MLYYLNLQIVLKEIPDEVSLGISLVGCPHHCKGCHSPFLHDTNLNINDPRIKELTVMELKYLIQQNPDVTCILFLGGDWDMPYLRMLLKRIEKIYDNKYKRALYTGESFPAIYCTGVQNYLDYLKVGRYDKRKGGLDSPKTNQRLYKLKGGVIIEDMTPKFFNKRSGDGY